MAKRLFILAGLVIMGALLVVNAMSDLGKLAALDIATPVSSGSGTRASTSAFAYPPMPDSGSNNSNGSDTDNDNDNATTTADEMTMNWAGYMSTGDTYTSISGSWVVPSVTAGDDSVAADATWIGIGGVTTNDLIQVGTENMVEDGQVTGSTFYEQLPDSAQTLSTVNVNPGDTVVASLKETTPGEWSVNIEDVTDGESYSNTAEYSSSETSAEWIEEAPSDGSGIMPLDEFGSVAFTNGATTDNGTTVSIAGSNGQVVGMDGETGESLASVSALNSEGTGFTVTRTDVSSTDDVDQYTTIPGEWTRHEPGLDAYGGQEGGNTYPDQTDGYSKPTSFSVYGLLAR